MRSIFHLLEEQISLRGHAAPRPRMLFRSVKDCHVGHKCPPRNDRIGWFCWKTEQFSGRNVSNPSRSDTAIATFGRYIMRPRGRISYASAYITQPKAVYHYAADGRASALRKFHIDSGSRDALGHCPCAGGWEVAAGKRRTGRGRLSCRPGRAARFAVSQPPGGRPVRKNGRGAVRFFAAR